ncbi:type VII secretion protein EsaA, partial [Bacillus pseudomycoides]
PETEPKPETESKPEAEPKPETGSKPETENDPNRPTSEEKDLPSLPSSFSLTFKADLDWTLDEEMKKNSFVSVDYSWIVNEQTQVNSSYAEYIDVNKSLISDLPELLKQFQMLDSTAQQIVTLFGNPENSISIDSYADMINKTENQEKTLEELANPNSVYRMYNNITDEQKRDAITDKIYEEFKNKGNQLYTDIEDQIKDLQETIGSTTDKNDDETKKTLYRTLNLMTEPQKFLNEADKLNNWFVKANQQINETYQSGKENEKIQEESVNSAENLHPAENDTISTSSETDSLVKEMEDLVQSSKNSSESIEKSAAKAHDISPKIQELKETTDNVQKNADTVLNNLNTSVTQIQKNTSKNEQYSEEFSKVLSNTKQGGADNYKVFNFLSDPLATKGSFEATRQTSIIPYYMTLVGAVLSVITGISLCRTIQRREITKDMVFITPTRAWLNVPNVMKVTGVSLIISLFFAGITTFSILRVFNISWFSYTFLNILGGTLLITGFSRQFKNITLYVCVSLLGLYLMLTPLLGMHTRPGSIVDLLYRFSPLQNIENGYTALSNGIHVGWESYLLLVIIIVVGIGTNFIAFPGVKKSEKAEQEQ